jgi:tripartite-type tricarboxylate transporter receptor subunit TctC
MRRIGPSVLAAFSLAAACVTSASASSIDFRGKTITMLIGYAPGGGTDLLGRAIAASIPAFLPGQPSVIVQNMPGAEGTTAANYFANQASIDGLTVAMGAATQTDPLYFRRPQSKYIPSQFKVIGGANRGGTGLFIRKSAVARLYDRTSSPVIMGSLGGIPRAGMQAAAWGAQLLGWNIRWVVGYPGTNQLFAALHRGEIEMTSTAVPAQVDALTNSGEFEILAQSGSLRNRRLEPQPAFGPAPLLNSLLESHLGDGTIAQSFAYWSAINSMDVWMSLPPKASEDIVQVYRNAFEAMIRDRNFKAYVEKIEKNIAFRTHEDVELLLGVLDRTSPEAIDFISTMLRSQGLTIN